MLIEAEDFLMNGFTVILDSQQQMAGQALFRAHKLRLVAQIPGLDRGEIRLRRLTGDIGKGDFQPGVMQHDSRAFWRRKVTFSKPDGKGGGDVIPSRRRNSAFRNPRDYRLLHLALALPGLLKGQRIGSIQCCRIAVPARARQPLPTKTLPCVHCSLSSVRAMACAGTLNQRPLKSTV